MHHSTTEPSAPDLHADAGNSTTLTAAFEAGPSALIIALGVVIVLAVGFAPGIAHNAAHDLRHTMIFPCH